SGVRSLSPAFSRFSKFDVDKSQNVDIAERSTGMPLCAGAMAFVRCVRPAEDLPDDRESKVGRLVHDFLLWLAIRRPSRRVRRIDSSCRSILPPRATAANRLFD